MTNKEKTNRILTLEIYMGDGKMGRRMPKEVFLELHKTCWEEVYTALTLAMTKDDNVRDLVLKCAYGYVKFAEEESEGDQS